MAYIILDLEWNQCPEGKSAEIAKLPFEIIEIGAVRLDENFQESGRFREVVKPQVYRRLHYKTREIVSLRAIDFEHARTFPEVIADFLAWCGEDAAFCTWGPADLTELQRNLAYHSIPSPFPFPLLYFDIQKIFSIVFEEQKYRHSLEYAVDFLNIPKNIPFHSALSDAHYTALIMQNLTQQQVQKNSSVDYYHTPRNRKQEFYLNYENYTKFVSKPFPSKNQAIRDRVVASTVCHRCQEAAQKKIRWFPVGSRNYLCLAYCEDHGYLKGKIRLRKSQDSRYYAIKTMKLISPDEAREIHEKRECVKLKRRVRGGPGEEKIPNIS